MKRIPTSWLVVVAALALGEAFGLAGSRWASFWPLTLVLSVLVACFGFARAWRGWGFVAVALLGLALSFRLEAKRAETLLEGELRRGPFVAEISIEQEPRLRGGWASCRSECRGLGIEVIFPVGDGNFPQIGERWRVAGWLERKDRSDRRLYKLWVKGRGTFAARMGEMPCGVVYRCAAKLRRRLSRALILGLGEGNTAAALHRAMLLGERASLPRSDRESFIAAGTMHVFAISGLHVGVVAILIVMMLMFLLVPLRLAGALMVPVLWGYVVLIGCPPSAVRAALMSSCYFSAPLFYRKSDGLVAWCQAFLIVHIWNPAALISVGNLLSFTVMFSILAFDRWARAMSLSGLARTFGFAFAIWAAGAPIGALAFGRLTPGGMLANLIVVPLATASVSFGFLGMLSGLICPIVGAHLNNVAALVTNAMRGISVAVASVPGAMFDTTGWSFLQCALWYLALVGGALCLLFLRHRGLKL